MKKAILIILAALALGAGSFYYLKAQEARDRRFSFDPGSHFVTDIPNSRRMLTTDIVIQMADDTRQSYFEANIHRIRNAIIFILRSKSESELTAADIETVLNNEIVSRLNADFACSDFQKVYFSDFVIQ